VKQLHLGLLLKELLLFAPILLLGLLVSSRYYGIVTSVEKMSTSYSVPWFLICFAIAVIIILTLIKFVKLKLPFQIILSMTFFIGTTVVLDVFMAPLYSLMMAAALVGLYWVVRNILIHDLIIIVSIAGVAVYLGLILPITAILILFGLVMVYDVIAVFRTGHMVDMFHSMADRGMVMALIIPKKISSMVQKVGDLKTRKGKHEVVFLGTGDAAFPAMLAVAALQRGLNPALGVVIGALLGVVIVHFLLIKLKRPLPALPPIALLSAAGYFIGILL